MSEILTIVVTGYDADRGIVFTSPNGATPARIRTIARENSRMQVRDRIAKTRNIDMIRTKGTAYRRFSAPNVGRKLAPRFFI